MPAATEQSEPDVTEIRELEERLDNFRIQVADDLTIRGSAWEGYALNTYTCDEIGQGGGPPTPVVGACCFDDGHCESLTAAACIEAGGTVTGGDCDPNPCPQPGTGACCVGTDCTIETESDCTDMGGMYQGDDTTCDPNPCMVDCSCGFPAFDGSGRMFLNYNLTRTGTYAVHHGGQTYTQNVSHNLDQHYEGCDLITDDDTASSDHDLTPPGLHCAAADEHCFGPYGILGTVCAQLCDSCASATDVTVNTATTSTHTYTVSPVGDCDGQGSDVIIETLSNECNPV